MITSKQRAYLRGLANSEVAILQVGKGGITEPLLATLSDALEARELIVAKLTGLGFRRVTLDLAGFRSGSFDDRFEDGGAGNV